MYLVVISTDHTGLTDLVIIPNTLQQEAGPSEPPTLHASHFIVIQIENMQLVISLQPQGQNVESRFHPLCSLTGGMLPVAGSEQWCPWGSQSA